MTGTMNALLPSPAHSNSASEPDLRPNSLDEERRTVDFLAMEFLAIVVTQKLAIPLQGDGQIPLAIVLHYGALGWLIGRRKAEIDTHRLILFCMFSGAAVLAQLGNTVGSYSTPSLGLMLMSSLVLVVITPLHQSSYFRLLGHFTLLSAGASALVLVDWLTQLAGLGMPSLETLIPQGFNYSEYVYVQPLQWDSPWLKPNGFFFLEASHVSQFIAMGLVIELAYFRRVFRCALGLTALVLTFGGTGLIILGLAIPFLLGRIKPLTLVVIITLTLIAIVIAGEIGLLNAFTSRAVEFSQTNSSAYNRFIMPAERFLEFLNDQPARFIFGSGAGTMPKAINNLTQLTFGFVWPPYVKVAVEYGVITFASWFTFIIVATFFNGTPFIVGWIAFIQYQFLNGSLNVPVHTIYCWLLCAGYHIDSSNRQLRPSSAKPLALCVPETDAA